MPTTEQTNALANEAIDLGIRTLSGMVTKKVGGDQDFREHLNRALTSGINAVLSVHHLEPLGEPES